MLNINDQIEDNNSENVEESLSEGENGIYPIVNLNISLNNGKKESLVINGNDNFKEKVKEFCLANRISPSDEEVLLQRVKEELDTKSINKTGNFNYDNLSTNKNIEEPTNGRPINNNFLDYVPKEKNRLDQILNESDSVSVSQSLKQSTNKLDSLIREYKTDDDDEKGNNLEQTNIIEKTSNITNIKSDLEKSINPIISNSKQLTLFSNDNFMNSVKNNNSPNHNNKPTIIKSDYNNLNNNINTKAIPNKEINKYDSYYGKKNNQLLNNNSGINKAQVNNTYKDNNNTNNNILPLNNNNYTQENINPFTSLINQKVEFLDTYNNNIQNNKNNNIISSPKTQPKTIIYNTIQNGNNGKYNQIENPKIGTIITNNNKVILQNRKEPYNYNYEKKTFNSNQSNPNIYNHSNDIYKQINNMNRNESIAFNNNQGHYTNLNNLINKKDINYDFTTNQNNQSSKCDIVNKTEYSTYENMNFQGFNGNFDKANNQILKYNNNEILNSPTLNGELNQKNKYENSPNIFSNQNSQYYIYKNIQSPKSLKNNNYINGLNNLKEDNSNKIQKVKVLKLENFDYNLNQNKSNKLTDVNQISNNKNLNINENNNLNGNININTNLINNNHLTTHNNNLNKNPNLNNILTKNINNSNYTIINATENQKINNNLKAIKIPINKNYNNDINEINVKNVILSNKAEDIERKANNKEINRTIETESNYNEKNNIDDKNSIEKDIINEMRIKTRKIESINDFSKNYNIIKTIEKNDDNIEEKEPQDNYKKKKRLDLPRHIDENQTQKQYDKISAISKNNITILTNHESSNSKINICEINNTKNNISKNNINRNKINNIINNNKNQSNIFQKKNNPKDLSDNLSQNNKKEVESISSNRKIDNYINNKEDNNSYNSNENLNENILGNINFENYLDKELDNKKPKYKKISNLENIDSSSQLQSLQNSQIKKYSKNTYQQKNNNNRNKPMKILTFPKNEFSSNKFNKRSNSSGANEKRCNISRSNNSGERLYHQYKVQLQRKEELKKKNIRRKDSRRE